MKQRGKRIRPSDKDLVFHFTIASLLPVFLLVVWIGYNKLDRKDKVCKL